MAGLVKDAQTLIRHGRAKGAKRRLRAWSPGHPRLAKS